MYVNLFVEVNKYRREIFIKMWDPFPLHYAHFWADKGGGGIFKRFARVLKLWLMSA